MTNDQVEAFISKWAGPNFDFPKVPFRKDKAATFSTEFGIDDSTKPLFPVRVHLGSDRRVGENGIIVSPFDGIVTVMDDPNMYGTLTRILVDGEFEIRTAHIYPNKHALMVKVDDIRDNKGNVDPNKVRGLFKMPKVDEYYRMIKSTIKQGELIGVVGDYGMTAGAHSHTELVSVDGASELIEEILKRKKFNLSFYSDDELKKICGSDEMYKALRDDMTRKAITAVGPHVVKKWDKWTNKPQTYYDIHATFAI